jgi:hypothetical protein
MSSNDLNLVELTWSNVNVPLSNPALELAARSRASFSFVC